ncbi:tetratricopeptide repeat protein [Candidatus Nitrosacidococcus tergens]|uniref:Tetratricopeptide TPR_2 repeat protein n=1 Tax=Candidatus Nitrosacidococcus tergens TaxID=553981 RepID=A0A7G1QBS7_9GAMM|nr:tetratricopeptide repeat protein [Candidatus Nitrosacidococcus tergens]CAB1277594.1 Tetratricopeptide TPR_2 repeat protein [Candidatus Nitrosacidococcus tergens]
MKQTPFPLVFQLTLSLLLVSCTLSKTNLAAEKIDKNTLQYTEKENKSSYSYGSLTPKLLYQLISAEIAGQQGQIAYAMENYLLAAESTQDIRLAERATRIALFARNISYATRASKLWVQIDPKNEDARQVLIAMLLQQEKYNEVKNHLTQLVIYNTKSKEEIFLQIAILLIKAPDSKAATSLMRGLDAFQRKDPDALYGYAYLTLELNQFEESLQAISQISKQFSNSDKIIAMEANILEKQGKEDESVQILRAAVKNNKKASFFLRLAYGQTLMRVGSDLEAHKIFNQLEKEQPENPDVLLGQGALAIDQREYKQAEDYFRQLLKIDPSTTQARFYLGRLAELQNRPEIAMNWYSSITQGSLIIDAQIRQAILLAKQHYTEEARNHLHLLSQKFPEQKVRFQLAEGEILTNADRYEEALSYYSKALENQPEEIELLYARAMVAENLNKLDIVENDLHHILTASPDNAEALNALGYTLVVQTHRFNEALEYVSKAMKLKPNNAFILDSMGWIHYRLGDYDKAAHYLLKAIEIRKDPEIAAHLGEVLWSKGDESGARKVWEHALEDNQNSKVLLEVMQRFQK